MRARKLISKLHLWIGLSAGLIVSIVGLTGAIYVFAPELQALAHNRAIHYKPGMELISPDSIARVAEKKYKGRLVSFQNQRRAEHYYTIGLINPQQYMAIDPYTGSELGWVQLNSGFWYWVLEIHTTLTIGSIGSWVTGIASLLLAFMLISTGLYLWWPKTKAAFRQRFQIKWTASFKRKNYDLHSVGGFYIHFLIGMLAFTGACFSFQQLGPAIINFICFNTVAATEPKTELSSGVSGPPILFSEVLKRAEHVFPEYHLMHVYYSRDDKEPVVFTKTNHQWISGGKYIRTYTYLDRFTGKILYQEDPRKSSPGERITDYYKRQIHYGEIGGWLTRILAFFAGLSIPGLYITGFIVWLRRGKKS